MYQLFNKETVYTVHNKTSVFFKLRDRRKMSEIDKRLLVEEESFLDMGNHITLFVIIMRPMWSSRILRLRTTSKTLIDMVKKLANYVDLKQLAALKFSEQATCLRQCILKHTVRTSFY